MLLKKTLVHNVHFWLKSKQDIFRLMEGLELLVDIPSIRDIHIGVPAPKTDEIADDTFDASLLILFDSVADETAYLVHPLHQRFVQEYASLICDRVTVTDAIDRE